jgi:hypothetical protein
MGKNKKKKGKGGETGEKVKLPLEILNSIRRAQHISYIIYI